MRASIALPTMTVFSLLGLGPSLAAAQTAPGPQPAWVSELPSIEAVKAATQGSTPHETGVRVGATLELLEDFVYVLSGNSDPGPGRHGCPWPVGSRHAYDYDINKTMVLRALVASEHRPPDPRGLDPYYSANLEAEHLAETRAFAAEVLPHFVSEASRAAYFSAAATWYERQEAFSAVAAARQGSSQADVDCANARVQRTYDLMMRARKPNLFIMLESAHAAQVSRQTQIRAAEPSL